MISPSSAEPTIPLGFASDADDAVALDTDDPRPDDLAGVDVK